MELNGALNVVRQFYTVKKVVLVSKKSSSYVKCLVVYFSGVDRKQKRAKRRVNYSSYIHQVARNSTLKEFQCCSVSAGCVNKQLFADIFKMIFSQYCFYSLFCCPPKRVFEC